MDENLVGKKKIIIAASLLAFLLLGCADSCNVNFKIHSKKNSEKILNQEKKQNPQDCSIPNSLPNSEKHRYNNRDIRKDTNIITINSNEEKNINDDAKNSIIKLYDIYNDNNNIKIDFDKNVTLRRLYNMMNYAKDLNKLDESMKVIKNFLKNLENVYGLDNIYSYICRKINTKSDAESFKLSYGEIRVNKLESTDFLLRLLRFYNILFSKLKFKALETITYDLNDELQIARGIEIKDFYEKYPRYNNIYLYDKVWTLIDSLDFIFFNSISSKIKEEIESYNTIFNKFGSCELYLKTKTEQYDSNVSNIKNLLNKYNCFVLPFFITDNTYTECMILKYENGKCTKVLGSTEKQNYVNRYKIYKDYIDKDNPSLKKIFNVRHDGNCSAYSQYALLHFVQKTIELMNSNPNLNYIQAQNQIFDYLYDNVTECTMQEEDLINTQILAEFGIFKLFIKEK